VRVCSRGFSVKIYSGSHCCCARPHNTVTVRVRRRRRRWVIPRSRCSSSTSRSRPRHPKAGLVTLELIPADCGKDLLLDTSTNVSQGALSNMRSTCQGHLAYRHAQRRCDTHLDFSRRSPGASSWATLPGRKHRWPRDGPKSPTLAPLPDSRRRHVGLSVLRRSEPAHQLDCIAFARLR